MLEQITVEGGSSSSLAEGRRRFLERTINWLVGTMALLLGAPSAYYIFGLRKRTTDSRWMDAGDTSELGGDFPQEITFRRNRIDGWKIHSGTETAWLSKTADNKLIAFSPWCTHLGCAYHWDNGSKKFACPCHSSFFSIEGQVLAGPAPRPLDRYATRIENNRLQKTDEDTINDFRNVYDFRTAFESKYRIPSKT